MNDTPHLPVGVLESRRTSASPTTGFPHTRRGSSPLFVLTILLCIGWTLLGPPLQAQSTGTILKIEQIRDADGQRVGKRITTRDPVTGATQVQEQHYLLESLNPTGYSQIAAVIDRDKDKPWSLSQRRLHGHSLIGTAAGHDDQGKEQTPRHMLLDGHGSIRSEWSDLGPVTENTLYTAWGERVGPSTPHASLSGGVQAGYVGEVWDADLGSYDLRARSYSPMLGRLTTPDSFEGFLQDPLSQHRYLYCQGNPLNGTDPSGHFFSLSEAYYGIGARLYLAGATLTAAYPHAVHFAQATVAALTLGSLVVSEDARIHLLATGNPAGAMASVADDIGLMVYRGGRLIQQTASALARAGVMSKIEEPLGQAAQRIKNLADDAIVGYRGSVATGIKHSTQGPFNPEDFDLDAFIVSDTLAAKLPRSRFRDGRDLPEINAAADEVEAVLKQAFGGYRSSGRRPFTFRIWTYREYQDKVEGGSHVTF